MSWRSKRVTIKQEQPESVPDFAKRKYLEETEQQRYNLIAVLLDVSQRDWKIPSPEDWKKLQTESHVQ